MMGKILRITMSLLIVCVVFSTVNAYPTQKKTDFSLDPGIRRGTLPNGLSYYIKPISDSSVETSLNLLVKVGFNQEKPGEFEFSHIIEHLGVSSGKNVSFGKTPELFKEIGVGKGALTANTTHNHTSYSLTIPSFTEKGMLIGLRWLEDIIWNLELTQDNIDRERMSVYNEANGISFVPPHFSWHLERKLVGSEVDLFGEDKNEHLKSFKAEEIIGFHQEWYRPESMAIVIIGNIKNIDNLEDEIRNRFSKDETIGAKLEESYYPEYISGKPRFLKKAFPQKLDQPELLEAVQLMMFIRDEPPKRKEAELRFRNNLIKELFIQMINKRHNKNQEFYGVNFNVFSGLGDLPFVMKHVISLYGGFGMDEVKYIFKGFAELKQNGFTAKEFAEGKSDLLRAIVRKDTNSITYWRHGIRSHFVNGEPFPAKKMELERFVIENLTLEEFNNEIRFYLDSQYGDIALAAPPGHSVLKYTEKSIREIFAEFNRVPLPQYIDPQVPKTLIDSVTLSSLLETTFKEKQTEIPLGRKFKLQNGVKLILRPSPNSQVDLDGNKKIYFQGFVEKGVLDFCEEDFFSAMNAPAIVSNSGIGALDKFALKRYLDSIDFHGDVRPYIDQNEAGIKGTATLDEIEIALQLTHLYLTNPNFSQAAYEDWKEQKKKNLATNMNLNKEDFFTTIRNSTLHPGFFPSGTKALKGLKQIDFVTVQQIYKQLFDDPQDLTFIFTGDFDQKTILDLCRKYLGNVSAGANELEGEKIDSFEVQSSPQRKIVHSTVPMELAMVRLVYMPTEGINDFNWKEEIKIEILRRSIYELLMHSLRYESGTEVTYQIGVGRFNSNLEKYHEMVIDFSCEPTAVKRLIETSTEVVSRLKSSVIEEDLLKNKKESFLVKDQKFERPQEILKKIYNFERHGEKWVENTVIHNFIKSLTSNDIMLTAQKYLADEPYEFVMISRE